jgi:hypothetical protein
MVTSLAVVGSPGLAAAAAVVAPPPDDDVVAVPDVVPDIVPDEDEDEAFDDPPPVPGDELSVPDDLHEATETRRIAAIAR